MVRDRRAGTSGSTVIRSKVITSNLNRFPLLRHDPILPGSSINFSSRGIDLGCPPCRSITDVIELGIIVSADTVVHILPESEKNTLKFLQECNMLDVKGRRCEF